MCPPAPRSSIDAARQGRPATLLDLVELPIEIVHDDEWVELSGASTEAIDVDDVGKGVYVCGADIELDDPQLLDFANGRKRFFTPPESSAEVVEMPHVRHQVASVRRQRVRRAALFDREPGQELFDIEWEPGGSGRDISSRRHVGGTPPLGADQ